MSRQPPIAPVLSSLTGFLLRRAYALTVDRARSCLGDDANPRDVGILMILDERGPMSQGALADLMSVNRTIMVKLVGALEVGGYVLRERNPADRRAYALTITDAGRRRCEQLMEELRDVESTLSANLDAGGHARLNALLRRLLSEAALTTLPALRDNAGYLITVAYRENLSIAIDLLGPLGIEPRHFGALAVVDRDGPCTQQHVADRLGVSAPAVLPLIDDLELAGFIDRTRDASDRRSYDLTLTGTGHTRLVEALGRVGTVQAATIERLGADGDRELRELLRTVVGL